MACGDYSGRVSSASYVGLCRMLLRRAYDGSSGSLAPNFSDVRVAPVLPMVSTETVVVLLTACADLRLVSKERQLSAKSRLMIPVSPCLMPHVPAR